MRSHSTTGPLTSKARPAWPLRARRAVAALALLASAAVHASSLPVQQVSVGFANANLMGPISALTMPDPNNCGTPITPPCAAITATDPLITGGTAQNNFTTLTFVRNDFTGTEDVVYGDAAHHTIWLSKGPGYTTSTAISGPPCPSGMASDPSGNVIVISRSCPQGGPGVWILPMITTGPNAGTYGAPLLIDNTFNDPNTGLAINSHALAEVVVAGTAGPLWGTGDVIVLVSPVSKNDDRSSLRVIVYSQAAVQSVLTSNSALHGPTSNLVTLAQFATQSVGKVAPVPEGMDIGQDPNGDVTLYFSTADGRIIDFDSSMNAFTTPYVIKQGPLGKLRTFTWGAKRYVIVAQQTPATAGQILQFDGSSQTTPFASVSTGVDNPSGLAVTYSGSTPAGPCKTPAGCQILPQLTMNFTGSGTGNIDPNANIVADGCSFPDPRVTTNPVWSCGTDALGNNTLDLGAHCPNMPHVLLSPKTCGKSGPAGNGISATRIIPARTVEESFNNTFVAFNVNPNVTLPSGSNPNCGDPNGPIVLWGPDPNNPNESPLVPEGNTLIDTTNHCIPDPPPGGGGSHASIVVEGAVTTGYTATDIDGHFANLQTAFTLLIQPPAPQIVGVDNTGHSIVTTIQNYINQSKNYFDAQNYSCALNTLWNFAQYVNTQSNTPPTNADFITGTPPSDQNPAGTLLVRVLALYYQGNVFGSSKLGHQLAPTTSDALSTPQGSVPTCATLNGFTVVNAATGAAPSSDGTHFLLPETGSYSVVWTTTGETQCTLSTTDGLFTSASEPANSVFGSSPVTFFVGPEPTRGEAGEGHAQTAMLTCGGLTASFQYIIQEASE